MSLSLILGCLWVVASAITAMLPMRRQYAPGIVLLIAAPFLMVFIGIEHGALWVTIGLVAFVSMFRNPLIYLVKKALGRPVDPLPGREDRA
jgi:hypothetical protein